MNVVIICLYVAGVAKPRLYWLSRHMSLWSTASFNFAILINLVVALFYPFDSKTAGMQCCVCPVCIVPHTV